MPKKVLIITYYWPPAGGPGVQRWLKFAKYLPSYGIEPIIYVPENPHYPIVDNALLHEVPEDLKVLKHPIKEPYAFARKLASNKTKRMSAGVLPDKEQQSFAEKLLLYVRGNFFIPDARKAWVTPSVTYLLEYIKKHQIKTVITTGPPHSLHLIGLRLKTHIGVKWLADFRDPWTTIGYHKALKLSKWAQRKHEKLETEVLQTADNLIVTSPHTKIEFQQKTTKPITVITNGYDIHHVQRPEKDSKFSLSHIGSLLSGRNPEQLWEALRELLQENQAFKASFELNLIGITSQEVLKSLDKFQLTAYTNNQGYLSHDQALKAQMSTWVLLLIEIDSEDTRAIIPGKLFEYMVSNTPILAIGPQNSDVETILKQTNTGKYFYYSSKAEIKSQILLYFEAYKHKALQTFPIGLQQYSRKALTKQLAALL